jgi:hypothetical protein
MPALMLHIESDLQYLFDKKNNAVFADARWVDCRQVKSLWLRGAAATAVTSVLSLMGSLDGGATSFGLQLPTTQLVHTTNTTGTATLSGSTIVLGGGYTGAFAVCLREVPPFVRLDQSAYTSGGGAGATNKAGGNGLYVQLFGQSL